jgi:peptidoglycan/xylan/chitin deacetylase (PgdA/CDA1 family)
MYHRFGAGGIEPGVSESVFREQVRMLKHRFQVITLAELADRIENDAVEPNLAVITVDDGREDFYRIAFPILKHEGVPATFFVTTRFIDGDIWLWPDVVDYALEMSRVVRPDLSSLGVSDGFDLTIPAEKKQAWRVLVTEFIHLRNRERSERLEALGRILDVDIPSTPEPPHTPLGWDEILELSESGIEIGAHTLTHQVLVPLTDDELDNEILGSKRHIEERIGRPVSSFCYPNGALGDYDDRVVDAVRSAGYKCAVVAHFDGTRGDLFTLRRTGVDDSLFQYRKTLAGIGRLSNWRTRRSEYV